jgi:multiple sugar transport system substrate-binding protein
MSALRVALVGGPMYDPMYALLEGRDVEIVVHADHPTLNRRVAEMLGRGERLDLISTHAKYAPSQARWLRPLDDLVDPALLGQLAPRAVALCRFGGALLCLPRNVDVRVLWINAALCTTPPDTWAEVLASGASFAFPGRESGLFGTFFELVVGEGGRLFDDDGRPTLATPEAERAIATLVALAGNAPRDLVDWHYDQVDAALLDGRVAMAAAWPGGYGPIRRSAHYGSLAPHPYPAGPRGRFTYSGAHAWAIPRTCAEPVRALELLHALAGVEAARLELANGGVPAHAVTFATTEPIDEKDARRLTLTRDAIEHQMITYPPHAEFPAVEDAGWHAIRDALRGACTPADATRRIQHDAEQALRSREQA